MVNIVLTLSRQVTADDITALSRAANTSPTSTGGIAPLITVGKACPDAIFGYNTAAVMPMSVIPSASGISSPAVQNTLLLATCPSFAEKMREYMSGPTT